MTKHSPKMGNDTRAMAHLNSALDELDALMDNTMLVDSDPVNSIIDHILFARDYLYKGGVQRSDLVVSDLPVE